MKKIYFVGIGGIGVSALARYYLSEGYEVFGSDSTDSQLLHDLQSEGMDIIIGSDGKRISQDFEKVIYSEAVPLTQSELRESQKLGVPILRYNTALGEVVNTYKLIAVTGTHGKSTTTSMISQILKNSQEDFISIVGTLLQEFDGKNFYASHSQFSPKGRDEAAYFVIEACEHKEHFLAYHPTVAIITNIEYDHADYFKTPESYIGAYEKFINNIIPGGFCILSGEEKNSLSLFKVREDIHYIKIFKDSFELYLPGKDDGVAFSFPRLSLQIPGEHILYDAKLAYVLGHMIGIEDTTIHHTLKNYSGVWRRMEKIGSTENKNILMSDYAHHPTEISATLSALKKGYPNKKLFVIFQPHQYSRTLELLDDFIRCFSDANSLIIPDIYESRDSKEDREKINSQILAEKIEHLNAQDGQGLDNTLHLIKNYDRKYPDSSIILLLGAGSVDNLRYKINIL